MLSGVFYDVYGVASALKVDVIALVVEQGLHDLSTEANVAQLTVNSAIAEV